MAVREINFDETISEDSVVPEEALTDRLRFGIGYETTYTLDEVGKKFDLTGERIRQIEKETLKKLATLEMGEVLRSLLE